MSTHSDEPVYDPASWAANRSDAGWALLTMVWSSAFAGGAGAAEASGESDLASTLLVLSGITGLVLLIVLTVIGCRLAFGRVRYAPLSPPPTPATPVGDGTPSVRIVGAEPRRRRSDVQVMALIGLGIVLAASLVVAVITMAG